MLRNGQFLLQNTKFSNYLKYKIMAFKSSANVVNQHTAGVIIIGDEILKAQQRDTNSYFICTHLYNCGVSVKKISVISDDVDIISDEIRDFSSKYKYVITAGGIGPTHDDVTYEGLAKAFNDNLHYHPTMVDIVNKLFNNINVESSPGMKLAYIPQKSTLRFGKKMTFPCINVENVYVFPGSPRYLEPAFESLCDKIFHGRKFITKTLYTNVYEEFFANELTAVAKEFPSVTFGSYPVTDQRDYNVIIRIEGENQNDMDTAIKRFYDKVPSSIFVNIEK